MNEYCLWAATPEDDNEVRMGIEESPIHFLHMHQGKKILYWVKALPEDILALSLKHPVQSEKLS